MSPDRETREETEWRRVAIPTGGDAGRRETAWSRETQALATSGSPRRWMLERVVCAHRGLSLTGPRERALVWEMMDAWDSLDADEDHDALADDLADDLDGDVP